MRNQNIGVNLNELTDEDALVYSAYLDLLRLTNEKSAAPDIDDVVSKFLQNINSTLD